MGRAARTKAFLDRCCRPDVAEPLYELFVSKCETKVGRVATGSFRRMMQVELVNDGPVTILLDSRKQF